MSISDSSTVSTLTFENLITACGSVGESPCSWTRSVEHPRVKGHEVCNVLAKSSGGEECANIYREKEKKQMEKHANNWWLWTTAHSCKLPGRFESPQKKLKRGPQQIPCWLSKNRNAGPTIQCCHRDTPAPHRGQATGTRAADPAWGNEVLQG